MRFVDHDQLNWAELFRALVRRLNTGDDNRLIDDALVEPGGIAADELRIDERSQLLDRLLQKLFDVREHDDATAPFDDLPAKLGDHERLAGAGR